MSKFPIQTRNFQLDKVEISSSNSKFPVGMSKFPVWRSRNFQFKLEISSSNSKFPVGQSGNFQFELEISSWNVEISSLKKSKFPVQTRNFQFELEISSSDLDTLSSCNLWITSALIPLFCRKRSMVNEPIRWNNYITNQQLEISTSSKWNCRVQSGTVEFQTGNFDFQTGNFDFGKLEISTSQLEISSSNSKFRVSFQARMFKFYTEVKYMKLHSKYCHWLD